MPVIVIDAESTDRTADFARKSGARVIERAWTGFLETRSFALAQVTTPWAFFIDADESLDDVLRDAVLAAPENADGYVVRRTTFYCGKALRMWRREPLVRLFRVARARLEAKPAARGGAALHERWICDGLVGELPGTLLHYSYPDAASYHAKFERYTSLEAKGLRSSLWRVVAEWFLVWPRFARLLLLNGALLDGLRGIAAAYGSARYRYVVALKAWR